MPVPRMRFTVRRMMVFVLCLGIILHLTVAAWRAHLYGGYHLHSNIVPGEFGPGWGIAVRSQPFWPTFWRHSTGLTWGEQQTCLTGGTALMDVCEVANPEIRIPLGPNTYAANYTKEQKEFLKELTKSYEIRSTAAARYNQNTRHDEISLLAWCLIARTVAARDICHRIAGSSRHFRRCDRSKAVVGSPGAHDGSASIIR